MSVSHTSSCSNHYLPATQPFVVPFSYLFLGRNLLKNQESVTISETFIFLSQIKDWAPKFELPEGAEAQCPQVNAIIWHVAKGCRCRYCPLIPQGLLHYPAGNWTDKMPTRPLKDLLQCKQVCSLMTLVYDRWLCNVYFVLNRKFDFIWTNIS